MQRSRHHQGLVREIPEEPKGQGSEARHVTHENATVHEGEKQGQFLGILPGCPRCFRPRVDEGPAVCLATENHRAVGAVSSLAPAGAVLQML